MPFARILRSSALMGGAQAVTLAMAFLRSKLIAVLIGPSGIGLMGVFNAFNANLSTVAGWGLGTSAVRTVAGAPESERARKVAAVRKFGRRLAWIGSGAMLLLVLPIGQLTFESQRYALELLIAGLAVPCLVVTGMWSALLQAGGHVGSLARTQVISAVAGLLVGLPFIYYFGSVGVALSLFFAAFATAVVMYLSASRSCPVSAAEPTPTDIRELLYLGAALQVGAVLGAISSYLVRVLILRSHGDDLAAGLADAGFYQAAFAITGSLPGVIFSATSSDFYPRVTAAKDEAEARQVTETQIRASLLLALPLLMALLTMGPLAVRLLYAEGFGPSVPLLTWFAWAIFCLLIGWPLGLWVMARRAKRVVVVSQSLLGVSGILLAWMLVPVAGVRGAAIAYFGSGLFYVTALLVLQRRTSGRWIGVRTAAWVSAAAAALAAGQVMAAHVPHVYLGLILTCVTAATCAFIYFKVIASATLEEHAR